MKSVFDEYSSTFLSTLPTATIFVYIGFSFYFSYELTLGQIWSGKNRFGLTPQESGLMNLTFTLFVPHIIYVFHAISGRIRQSTMAFLSLWFEIGYICVGSFILIVWCLESGGCNESEEPTLESAEPLFVLVSVSLAMFEYRERLWRRIKILWQTSKIDKGE